MLLPAVIEAKLQQILQPLSIPRPVTQPPLNVKPKLNFSTHPSAKQLSPELAPNRPLTLACQRSYGSESNLLDSLSSAADDSAVSGDSGNWSRSGLRAAGSVPDLLSPRHMSDEPPPLPPERPVATAEKPDAGNTVQPGYYDTPGTGDNFYNTPLVKYPHQSEAADFYNVPPSAHQAERGNIDGACYDVPPTDVADMQSAKKSRKHQPKAEVCEVTGGDVYNVPPSHSADNSWISAGSPAGEFYENVPSGSGKKSKKGRNAVRTGPPDNQKPFSQTASVCFADQTYDVPSAEQQSHLQQLASRTDETYDTPTQNQIKDKKKQPKKPVDKQSDDVRPLTNFSDQTYDTPPTSASSVNARPNKPHREKPRSSLESSEGARNSEQFSGQETYDVPPTVQHPSAAVKPTAAAQQASVPRDDMYDVPPLKSATSNSFERSSLAGAADLAGLSQPGVDEEQTYNVPASCVPPVPAKRNPAPPPKPPRPTVALPAHRVVSATVTSVSSTQETVKAVDENEVSEKDTVPELPTGGSKGMLK